MEAQPAAGAGASDEAPLAPSATHCPVTFHQVSWNAAWISCR